MTYSKLPPLVAAALISCASATPQPPKPPPDASGGPGLHGDAIEAAAPLELPLGRLPAAVIQQVVRSHFGIFRKCYEAGLGRDPHLSGGVSTRFVIARDGHVSSAVAAGRKAGTLRMQDQKVVDCVVAGFTELVFPEPEGAGNVTVVYPIVFAPGD